MTMAAYPMNAAAPGDERSSRVWTAARTTDNLLRDAGYILHRYRAFLIWMCLAAISLIVALDLVIVSRYTAEGRIAVDPSERAIINFQQDQTLTAPDQTLVKTVIEQLKSNDLAIAVVTRAKAAFGDRFMRDFGDGPDEQTKAVEKFLARFDARQIDQSNVVRVSYSSPNRDVAQAVVTFVFDALSEQRIAMSVQSDERANADLRRRVKAAAQTMRIADNAVEAFKAKNGLVNIGDMDIVTAQLSSINLELTTAETTYKSLESERRALEQLIASSNTRGALQQMNFMQGMNARTDSGNQVLSEEAEIRQQLAVTRSKLGEDHPDTKSAEARYAAILRDIDRMSREQVSVLSSRVDVAKARYTQLSQKSADLQNQIATLRSSEVELNNLEMEAKASHDVYSAILGRMNQTDQAGLALPAVEVISRPILPMRASFPNMPLIGALVFLAIGGIALGAILLCEMQARGIRTLGELERRIGVPGIGLVPETVVSEMGVSRLSQALIVQPFSFFSESIRSLGTLLMTPNHTSETLKTIMITSAFENEGKTSVSSSLATFLAQAEYRVLLIDCDLRRPRVNALFGLTEGAGLTDLVLGNVPLEQCIRATEVPGLSVLPTGMPTDNVDVLLASPRAHKAIDAIKSAYDFVIIDTSPMLVVSDALSLAGTVDAVLMVVRWNGTKAECVGRAYQKLANVGAKVRGAVLTKVKMEVYARLEEGQSSYNVERYRKYVTFGGPGSSGRSRTSTGSSSGIHKGVEVDAHSRKRRFGLRRHQTGA